MSKIQYNVGTFKGLLGTAILYIAKTSAGTEFITYQVLEGNTEYWAFMSRTSLQSLMITKDVVISSNVDVSKLPDVAPDGVLDANGHVILDNATGLPRLSTGQGYYTLKGSGVADYAKDPGSPTSGDNGSGSTVVIASKAKTFSETISEAATWATKNWMLTIVIIFFLLEAVGATHVLREVFGSKKKKPVKQRR